MCVCVVVNTSLCFSPLDEIVYLAVEREECVCVGEQRDPTCYESLRVAAALIHSATPSRC